MSPEQIAGSGLFDTGRPRTLSRLMPADLDAIEWEFFEALVAEVLENEYGGEAQLTKRSNDKGCDVVLRSANKNLLAQCKASGEKRLRGDSFVREIHGARTWYQDSLDTDFPVLAVFTNARTYGRDGKKAARLYDVGLFDRSWLAKGLKRHVIDRAAVLKRIDRGRL